MDAGNAGKNAGKNASRPESQPDLSNPQVRAERRAEAEKLVRTESLRRESRKMKYRSAY